jgi:hypothetical protein
MSAMLVQDLRSPAHAAPAARPMLHDVVSTDIALLALATENHLGTVIENRPGVSGTLGPVVLRLLHRASEATRW